MVRMLRFFYKGLGNAGIHPLALALQFCLTHLADTQLVPDLC